MANQFISLIASPITTRTEESRLRIVLITLFGLQMVAPIIFILVNPGVTARAISAATLAHSLICLILLRYRHLQFPRITLPLVALLSIAYASAVGSGIRDQAIPGIPVIIVAAALILGRRGAATYAVLATILVFVLYGMETRGLLETAFGPENPVRLGHAINLAVYFGFATVAVFMLISFMQNDLKAARDSEAKMQKARAALEERTTELEESEARYRLLADNARDVVFLMDMDLNMTYVSPSVIHQRGFTPEEAIQQGITDIVTPESVGDAAKLLQEELAIEAGADSDPDRSNVAEFQVRCKDGSLKWIESVTGFLRDDNGTPTHILGISRDISQRKQSESERDALEREMLQMQKMESLGILAGGIAHDFNNLLLGIMANADLAARKLPHDSPARKNLDDLITTSERAADLCRQLLAYSGKGRFVVKPVDLAELIDDMTALLDVSISKKIRVESRLEKGIAAVDADVTQLRQVMMNLILNAADAIGDDDGTITLAVHSGSLSDADLARMHASSDAAPGPYVFVEVRDTGKGMDEDVLGKIFDPFYTTKSTGHGLGLAAVLGVVRGHGGAIGVESAEGAGTTVRVAFPESTSEASPLHVELKRPDPARLHGTILVVDDEELVRSLAKDALESNGFGVLTAANGKEAVEIFSGCFQDIAAVLLDMTMPVMGGEEAFERLREIQPDVRIVLSSGYEEEDSVSRFTSGGLAGFIHKPYLVDDLIAAIEDALAD